MKPAPKWISRARARTYRADALLGAAIVCAAMLIPLTGIGSVYGSSIAISFMFYALVTFGWTIQAGSGGQFNLAPAAFVMLGAYVSGILANYGMATGFGILFATMAGAAAGTLVAGASSRLSGHYFALATLIAGELARVVVTNEYRLTRGELGLQVPTLFSGAQQAHFALIFGGVLLLAIGLLYFALKGSAGLALQAIRDDETVAGVRGLNVTLTKLIAVTTGSAVCAFAGAVYVHFIQLATPQMGALHQTTLILAIGIVGGIRTISGPIVGAALIIGLQEVLRDFPFIHMTLTAIAILLTCLVAPGGVSTFMLSFTAKSKSGTPREAQGRET